MIYSEYSVESAATLVRRVFGWTTLGLTISGLTAFMLSLFPAIQKDLVMKPGVMLILILAQLGLVLYLSFGLERMSSGSAIAAYLLYSFVTGVTLSILFIRFTGASLALTFFICAAMFAVMAIYGLITKSDLSGLGTFLFMGLIGLIIAGFINMFVQSAKIDFVASIFGVFIFTIFTAYDVQMVKKMGMMMLGTGADMTKVSIISALKLYLDFVNLFLYLLRFFGQKKD